MAIQVSGTTVVDDSRNLTNISSFGSSVTKVWSTVTASTANTTLVNRQHHTVTSDGVTITLPNNPTFGWEVLITVGGNFNNITLSRSSGILIMGFNENMIIDLPYASVGLNYVPNRGWVVS